jgi:hypothetical protein
MKTALLVFFLVFVTPYAAVGNPALQKSPLEQAVSQEIRCVLSIDKPAWERTGPALVRIRLENLTNRDLELTTIPTFYLSNQQVTYWSPTDIARNKELSTQRQTLGKGKVTSIRPVPLKVSVRKYSTAEFVVDAARTKWQQDILSVWPSLSLGTLLAGSYSLRLELSDTAGKLVRSNQVGISLEK